MHGHKKPRTCRGCVAVCRLLSKSKAIRRRPCRPIAGLLLVRNFARYFQKWLTDVTLQCCYSGRSIKQKEIAVLILTRRVGESIIIETPARERITVTVLGVKGNQVRIGTDAPDDIHIVREELLERLQNQA